MTSARLQIASGNGQEAEVGTVAPEALRVRVLDGNDAPVAGAPVVWAFSDGGGLPSGGAAARARVLSVTNAEGHAETSWSLGTTAGNQEVTAHLVSPAELATLTDTTTISSGSAWTAHFQAVATPGAPSSLSTSPDAVQATPGQTIQLQAEAEDRFGNEFVAPEVQWTSSDEAVAQVDGAGVVTAVSMGSAEITARAESMTASTSILVDEPPLSVAVRPNGVTLSVGDTMRFDASIFDANNQPVDGVAIEWSSSDESVLTVDGNGLARAEGPGIAAIIATTEGGYGEEQVSVVSPSDTGTRPDRVDDLRVASTTDTEATLRWTAVQDGTGSPARYTIRYGTPTIRWWAAYETEVVIGPEAVGTRVTHTFEGLEPGTTYQFQVIGYRGTLNQNAVFGSLSNIAGASTDDPPAPDPEPVTSITVSPTTHTFTSVGQTRTLSVTGRDAQGREVSGAEFRFESSNPSIASVDQTGRITARAAGAATIIVSSVCCSAESSVNVLVEPEATEPVVESVTVTPTRRTFTSTGQTAQITATAYDGDGDAVQGAEFTYESTNPSIVSVDDMGRMTARAAGIASIIVAAVCCSAEAAVHVDVDPDDPPPSADGAFFADDFDNGRATNANGFTWAGSPDVSRDVAHSGSHSLKFSFGPTEPDGSSHWWTERRFDMGREVSELWMEYYIYFPSGDEGVGSARYAHSSAAGSSHNNKFLSLWADSYQSEPLAIFQLWQTGTEDSRINVGITYGDRDGDSDLIRYPGGNNGGPFIASDADRGRWIQVRVHVRLADHGQSNGVLQLWKDGVALVDLRNEAFFDESGANNYLRRGYLMGYDNGRFEENTWIYIDTFRVYDVNPGW